MNAHRRRSRLLLPIGVAVATLLLLAISGGLAYGLIMIARIGAEAHQLRQDLADSNANVSALSSQVESLGEEPVVTPDDKPSGPAGVSETQVRAIVAEELLDRDLTLTPRQIDQIAAIAARQVPKPQNGQDGQPGPPPTPEQVRTVVEQVVAETCANDACRGEDGTDGTDGRDGAPGPAPTDEQVAAAIAAYCEPRNGCAGRDGRDGQDGTPGRGVKSGPDFVRDDSGQCVARTTYTDGTTYDSPAGDAACPPAPLLGGSP